MRKILAKTPECPRCCPFPRTRPRSTRMAGAFNRASRKTPIQRYDCLDCGRSFSEATLTREYRQRKRHINHPLYELLVSCVSMRRSAAILRISRRTVERRLPYLALIATDHHQKFCQDLQPVESAQFDDMESWIHTKLKPVSIPMVVEHPSRLMLSFDVVQMPAKGRLAKISVAKYGKRADHRKKGWRAALSALNSMAGAKIHITSDSHTMYPDQIKRYVPNASHEQVKSRRACVVGQGELKRGGWDPIFTFNHTAAMVRANVNRMARRTWCTSKKAQNLKRHIAIYRLWHNETILARRNGGTRFSPFIGLC